MLKHTKKMSAPSLGSRPLFAMTTLEALQSRDQYTVGWIAALPLELAAATAMLDEQHARPLAFTQSSSDKNTYTWGRMGEHNVVIAQLPAGAYGKVNAAATALQMLSSFPHIRVRLMVGIGAAISKPEQGRDIRLGDIVVSQPDGQSGGVIQYDLGKAKVGRFERKGVLNMPPEALLKALAKLQAQHEILPSRVPEYLKVMVKRNPSWQDPNPVNPATCIKEKKTTGSLKRHIHMLVGSNAPIAIPQK